MTVIKNVDLIKATKAYRTQIEESKNGLESVSNQLESFITESFTVLKGEGYNTVRSALGLFRSAIRQQTKILDILLNNIKAANIEMLNYMGEYTELDTSKLEEMELAFGRAKQLYDHWNTEISKVDDNKDAKDLAVAKQRASSYKSLMTDISKLIEALKGLDAADGGAVGKLSGIISDIKAQNSAISQLNFSFRPRA